MQVPRIPGTDSTNAVSFSVGVLVKTQAAWSVGSAAGGLDTGSIANSTWYSWYAIFRDDTEVGDFIFSLNHTSPALPTGYTHFRRIGGAITISPNWYAIQSFGDWFRFDTPLSDSATVSTTPGTLRLTFSPPGVICSVLLALTLRQAGTGNGYINHWDPALGNTPPHIGLGRIELENGAAATSAKVAGEVIVRTNTSQQIYNMLTGNQTAYTRAALGWWDRRGQDD